ncbi:hypothetical protein LguiA_017250 [Lonicera macranthoides]
MATLSSISVQPNNTAIFSNRIQKIHSNFLNPKPFIRPVRPIRTLQKTTLNKKTLASPSSSSTPTVEDEEKKIEELSINALRSFIDLNLGNWMGSFHQFDPHGNLLHKLSTRLAVSCYGEAELVSLIQTLYIKQPQSGTSVSGDDYEPEWAEYKIKETNMFTVDKYQQIGIFPKEKAYALRYQTAGMLENVLRQGVLGEDDIGEESPKNLKLPSRRPSIVCESCLYSLEKDKRVRAFHVMDPKGVIEMLLIFLEERGDTSKVFPLRRSSDRILPYIGRWKGKSITKRTGVYGATIAEADTVVVLDIDEEGQLTQVISSTSKGSDITTNVEWKGTMSNNLVTIDGGYQMTLLPGGMYMGCPCNVGKSVAEEKGFHLEFCWLESPGKRQRLVRTFDIEGLAVSSTYFFETKL